MRKLDPSVCTLPFDDWPEADRNAWNRAFSDGGLFEDSGSARHLAPATRTSYRGGYGRWLRFLDHAGELDKSEDPTQRMTPARVEAFIASLECRELVPVSVWSQVHVLHNVLYHIVPGDDWTWLRQIVNALERRVPHRCVRPDQIAPIGDLYDAGFNLMENASTWTTRYSGSGNEATYYRDGLMISLLSVTLLRLKNFSSIRCGTHLKRFEDTWVLSIPASEIKNGRAYETEIPDDLTPYLERYVGHYRPQLLQENESDQLWISYQGQPMAYNAVAKSIKTNTRRLIGHPITPHRFRHCAATFLATLSPENALMIRALLEHSTMATSEHHYNLASTLDASRRHADALSLLRADLAQELEEHL